MLAAVGRDDTDAGADPEAPDVAFVWKVRNVGKDGGRPVPTGAVGRRADETSNRRAPPVGADNQVRADRAGGAGAVGDHNAPDPPRSRPLHGHQGDAMPDLSASQACGVDEDRIDHCPPRRIEGVDAVLMLDVDCDFLVAVAEYCAPYRRRAGGNDAVEEAPPL